MANISNKMFSARIIVITMLTIIVCANAAPVDEKLTLRIIHTNDMHSRFEEISKTSGYCSEKEAAENVCYGGFARMTYLVRKARNEATPDKPVFFLNAGDTYQGTKLFSYYKWKIVAKFLNILRPDVASLGNHEFDDKVSGLVPFLNNISFPIVAANLDLSQEPELQIAKSLSKSTILEAKNRKIGVIGYLTPETKLLSQPGNVIFLDEVESVRQEAKILKSQGCDIIIALGHSGYEVDKNIGREVEDVDLVIGGHTNTFLYSGPQPDSEKPEGFYPTEVIQPSGRKVYVVQAYAYTKYLGDLSIDFDVNGEITSIEGRPMLVDSSVPKAQDVEDELKKWVEPVRNLTSQVVGNTRVLLQGDEKVCRLRECNFGNLLTDAMIHHNAKLFEGENGWTDTAIAIHQAGGIRSSVSVINDEKVTMNDILTAFPFGTKVYKVRMTGKTLLEMLEWSVHDRLSQNTTSHGGGFLQHAGLFVTYNLTKPLNSRVVSAKVRCSFCIVPTYTDLNPNDTYAVLISDFMHSGGDGFLMLKELEYKDLNITIADVVANYINQTSPVYPGIEGRINFLVEDKEPIEFDLEKSSPSSATLQIQQISIFLIIIPSFIFAQLF